MTMENMVKELESHGFDVTREYKNDRREYKFTISKDGVCTSGYFEYNPHITPAYRDGLQRSFLNNLIKQFLTGPVMSTRIDGSTITKGITFQGGSIASLIDDVIFNNPATIVKWKDGTKTVVKCGANDIYDPEKGLAMAVAKKSLGNKGSYFETFKKWLPEKEESIEATNTDDPWKVWFDVFKDGKSVGAGLWHRDYARKGDAVKRAKKQYTDSLSRTDGLVYVWYACQISPFALSENDIESMVADKKLVIFRGNE